jgi:hypothetical protein
LEQGALQTQYNRNQRRQLLVEIEALIPALAALEGSAGLREAAHAIRDVGAWFP